MTSRQASNWVDRGAPGRDPQQSAPPLSVWLAERLLTPEELSQYRDETGGGQAGSDTPSPYEGNDA